MGKYILVLGDPIDGFTCEGPFNDADRAVEVAGKYGGNWWVAPLNTDAIDELPLKRDNLLVAIAFRFLREYDPKGYDGKMLELVAELGKIDKRIAEIEEE